MSPNGRTCRGKMLRWISLWRRPRLMHPPPALGQAKIAGLKPVTQGSHALDAAIRHADRADMSGAGAVSIDIGLAPRIDPRQRHAWPQR